MEKLFSFDVRLKDLMNLGDMGKEFEKLGLMFEILKGFWYTLEDKVREQERWNSIRVGSMDVYLDEDKTLCMKFYTRFTFKNAPTVLRLLEAFKD